MLILKFNDLGILINKKILNLDDMNDVKMVKHTTKKKFKQNNFVYNVFSSLREKINNPTKKKRR